MKERREKNKDTLRNALGALPSYDPPSELWSKLDEELSRPQPASEEIPQLKHLPTYVPPASVWNQLSKQLDGDQKRLRPKLSVAWLSGIAATLALLVVAGVSLLREPPPKISKQYSQETMEQFAIVVDWTADDESFDRLQEQLAVVNDPTLNNLKVELEELNSAREEVEAIMHTYGNDPKLVHQLGEIERVRSDIYRQIIELI